METIYVSMVNILIVETFFLFQVEIKRNVLTETVVQVRLTTAPE